MTLNHSYLLTLTCLSRCFCWNVLGSVITPLERAPQATARFLKLFLNSRRSSIYQPCGRPTGSVCAGGIPGIESSNGQACCLVECGQCGGLGCSDAGRGSECCVTDIVEEGEACSVTNEAPCWIGDGERTACDHFRRWLLQRCAGREPNVCAQRVVCLQLQNILNI